MDEAEREVALKAAKETADKASQALGAAQAELKKAQDAKDEAGVTAAQTKVDQATQAKADADAKVVQLEGDPGDVADALLGGDEELLADGTPKNKKISVAHDKFKDLSEKAALFEQFAPVLAKLQKDPTLVDKLMAGDDPNKSIAERLESLENRIKAEKATEVKKVITQALTTWPGDFRKHWDAVKAMLPGLEAQGVSYADAVQRAYFAVNPDAIAEGKRLVEVVLARDAENRRGSRPSPGGGGGPIARTGEDDEYQLSDADKEFCAKTGTDPKLYSKHAEHINRFADL